MATQFPAETYFSAVNMAVTYTTGGTQTFDDHGIIGTAGSDVVWDDIGNDIIDTKGGDDVIQAGSGNDDVFTNDGIDPVQGGTGHDYIDGGSETDSLWGDAGNDTLFGADGDDMVEGGADMDQLFGGAGNEAMWGGGAADTLAGGTGDDVLRGQTGYDTFVFSANSGTDLIADFNRTQDHIALDASSELLDFAAVLGAATAVAGDVVIALAGGTIIIDTLLLNQLNASQLDFI